MTIYMVTSLGSETSKSNSIVETLSKWIDWEIISIKDMPIDDLAPDGDIRFINFKNETINKLNNIKSNLVEKDGLKQFNMIMDIVDEIEGEENLFDMEYHEI